MQVTIIDHAHLVGISPVDFLLRLPLPIGISFFVFHNISLLVDLTRDRKEPPPLGEIILCIIFFPQLVSRPITRAAQFIASDHAYPAATASNNVGLQNSADLQWGRKL